MPPACSAHSATGRTNATSRRGGGSARPRLGMSLEALGGIMAADGGKAHTVLRESVTLLQGGGGTMDEAAAAELAAAGAAVAAALSRSGGLGSGGAAAAAAAARGSAAGLAPLDYRKVKEDLQVRLPTGDVGCGVWFGAI